MKNFDLIVVGGGPGGIFAAITAAEKGFKVALLEKNKRIGNKILVAGSGKCNLTHTGKPKDFLDKYGDSGKFLKEALNKFSPDKLKEFFADNGLPLVLIEESGKFFPATFSSVDVVNLLKETLIRLNVQIVESFKIEEILKMGDEFHIVSDKEEYRAKNVLLATGGKSYPGVGTTGDGYVFAKSLGHKIVPPQPALAPIYVKEYAFEELSGISFQDVKITFWKENRKLIEKIGSVLLTHTNFSGPGILDNSRYVQSETSLEINYIGLEYEVFNKDIIESINEDGKKTIKKYLLKYSLPERFVKKILKISEIQEDIKLSELSKIKREELAKMLTSNKMEISKVGNFEMAMVTKGGVSLEEVNSKTMESKKVKGLYFAGEILDIDGDTGGYNIQGACSMGVLAAKSMTK
ncbi:NAD(P)/FAD-dependent oxidoreductase [Cetobacterium sp. 8H]|uniref:NAD(P)/FAD-dependent oxidoreductase n=1 Tax=Cetobacterium sp. 8H TaxID=2759681 RepID=UPI00163BDACF|nr:NAD(P)/FAD-dependent oxidoreductase [Cetobacterium sp. 8H]MBC2852009.1 NAD(P)/FAD-dependent oxidoreductase [Cetobacterium sp. 8H]